MFLAPVVSKKDFENRDHKVSQGRRQAKNPICVILKVSPFLSQ